MCVWTTVYLLGGRASMESQAERKRTGGGDGGRGGGGRRVLIPTAIVS